MGSSRETGMSGANGDVLVLSAIGALAFGQALSRSGSFAKSGKVSLKEIEALGYSKAEISKARAAVDTTPSGRSAGPREDESVGTRYSESWFVPPAEVRKNALRGLELRKKRERTVRVDPSSGSGPGGTWIGVGRAIQLATEDYVPPRDIRRIVNYGSRHKVDRKAKGFGDEDKPTNGFIAELLWGNDESEQTASLWAEGVLRKMRDADGGKRRGSRAAEGVSEHALWVGERIREKLEEIGLHEVRPEGDENDAHNFVMEREAGSSVSWGDIRRAMASLGFRAEHEDAHGAYFVWMPSYEYRLFDKARPTFSIDVFETKPVGMSGWLGEVTWYFVRLMETRPTPSLVRGDTGPWSKVRWAMERGMSR